MCVQIQSWETMCSTSLIQNSHHIDSIDVNNLNRIDNSKIGNDEFSVGITSVFNITDCE